MDVYRRTVSSLWLALLESIYFLLVVLVKLVNNNVTHSNL